MKKFWLRLIGYIEVTDDNGKVIKLNLRSILRYEPYTNSWLKYTNTRLWYIDLHFLNLRETCEEINKII